MIFKTNRLKVRKLKTQDLNAFFELQSSNNVMRYTGTRPQTFEECSKDLNNLITKYSEKSNPFFVWAIENENNRFIGTCAVIKNDKNEWEIGFRLIEKYWNMGYGSEVTLGLVQYAFRHMNIKLLKAYVDKRNQGSVHILQKLFKFKKEYWNKKDQCYDLEFELSE
ncbi:Protein N-acetyltransferase, RimJ/RimL family [Zhouia amylolytica]|uniref:Protein N-acetyltransferase, RimJ/RimL family n=1 Tax=Zhouia amylolytica TaxID=376730 RepID=A0A1I6QEY6_9FLAO|nr:GNAT family N-acetyltransferase [Zhouia amylolytica]MCQ0111303.1 GNAT family N-acetyltransferase [Zhouia amylolytica]SFS50895.1 Protein N-acetyltransferase, RimJ/RimL family [Zhouia amylolytica]